MGQLPRTMMRCFLWCYAIAFYFSHALEGETKKRAFCYMAWWYWATGKGIDRGEIQELPYSYCRANEYIYNRMGAVSYDGSTFGSGELKRPKSENPLGCDFYHTNTSIWCPEDEEEFSQHDGYLYIECYCNQSPICATQPETFESVLNANGSDLQYCARKAGEILLEHLRAGKMKNNAAEALEKFMATSSTSISATKATSTGPSTTAGTTISTETTTAATSTLPSETPTAATSTLPSETPTAATSTLPSETPTAATSTSPTETSTAAMSTLPTKISTTATSTSPTEISATATSTPPTETSTTATPTSTTEVSTTFATTSDYEYSETSTKFAYDDQGLILDRASFTTSKTEDAEQEQMYSLLGQYGLAILVVCAISLIVIIAIIPVMLRDGKRKKHVEGAVGEGGTSKITGSRETSNEWSREGKTKEGGSKEVMTLSKEPVTLSKEPVTLSKEAVTLSKE